MIKTRKLKLVSSRVKKFVFPYDSSNEAACPNWKAGNKIEGNWEEIEDPSQFENLGKTYKVTYVSNNGGSTNKLHSVDDYAIQEVTKGARNKEYYINGIKYDKDTWKEMLNVSKMDPLLQTDKIFGN